ncbi:thiol peroxidase [Fusibacter ferrireducens]|uniref:Thiol peroxidase n=1 Tax=Fusibacter ferrireducens TaxID=2785058 RepID=A0ABR9ZRC0_9FIRM|nr:thiol peroxidase [Fusibacter ferrireducens]MBF4692979.1 thiol peroxidase [Fusibacter ferrireducens]
MRENITMGGNPIKLLGNEIKVNDKAPDFSAVNKDMTPFNFSELKGKLKIISVVPSVDTKICEFQTISFNEEATKHPEVVVLTISVDLPFAQQRFCVANDIENSIVVSDHRTLDFGMKYGFAIEDLRLLARGIVIVDKDETVKYVEYVKEVATHPDYDKALEFVKTLL